MWADRLDPEGLAQGDLVQEVVFANACPVVMLEKGSAKGGVAWTASEAWRPDANGVAHVLAKARKGLGLVLTHSCDIDKAQSKTRIMMAPTEPLSKLAPEMRRLVIEQARIAYFPLVGSPKGDLYADLRLATAIDPKAFSLGNRVASMTEIGREMLQARLVVLFTRKIPPPPPSL